MTLLDSSWQELFKNIYVGYVCLFRSRDLGLMQKTGELRSFFLNDPDSGSNLNILQIIYIYSDSARRDEAIGAICGTLACLSKKFVFPGSTFRVAFERVPPLMGAQTSNQ